MDVYVTRTGPVESQPISPEHLREKALKRQFFRQFSCKPTPNKNGWARALMHTPSPVSRYRQWQLLYMDELRASRIEKRHRINNRGALDQPLTKLNSSE